MTSAGPTSGTLTATANPAKTDIDCPRPPSEVARTAFWCGDSAGEVLTWTGNWVATVGWNMSDKRPQQEGDYLLAVFVSAINAGKMGELGISLLIGGQWLSGQLVAARDWFEGLGAYLDRIPMAGDARRDGQGKWGLGVPARRRTRGAQR